MPRIRVRSSACTGCRMCEMACSVNKTGMFSSRLSRIWIETEARVGRDVAHVCQQNIKACRKGGNPEPQCIAACPVAGETDPPIFWDDSLSMVVLRPGEACRDCLACVRACRFQAIRVHPLDKSPLKCDLCVGDPECVKICVTDAILVEGGQGAVEASTENPAG